MHALVAFTLIAEDVANITLVPGCLRTRRLAMDRIQLVALLTAIIHLTDTLFYAVRLSGVKTRRLITALSLFQLVALLAGVANMVQAPLLSAVVEQAINAG